MLFTIHPAAKLATITLAALLYTSSTTMAAPTVLLDTKTTTTTVAGRSTIVRDLECVKVASAGAKVGGRHVVGHGDQMRIRFDASGCDPILTENAQPWTASLVRESQDETHSVKLANWMEPGQREYNLVITAPSTTGQAPEQAPPSDFHVQVHSTTADGRVRLVGKTESFSIADALLKRQDVRFLPPDQATPSPPPINAPVFPAPPTADPNSNVDPSIPAPPASEAPKFPIPDSPTPEPTYPNTPAPPPADPATLPQPLNPPVEGVVLPSVTGPTPQPKRTNAATFLKYAGAGGAILSTIGTGVGGLVGGVVGGTIGLVLGLVIAGVNSVITF